VEDAGSRRAPYRPLTLTLSPAGEREITGGPARPPGAPYRGRVAVAPYRSSPVGGRARPVVGWAGATYRWGRLTEPSASLPSPASLSLWETLQPPLSLWETLQPPLSLWERVRLRAARAAG
jgi:hypothetical protein